MVARARSLLPGRAGASQDREQDGVHLQEPGGEGEGGEEGEERDREEQDEEHLAPSLPI